MNSVIESNVDNALNLIYQKCKESKKIFDNNGIRLIVVHKQIPTEPKSFIIELPNKLFSSGDRILLITKDIGNDQKARNDYEKTSEHFRKLMKKSKTSCPKMNVMSLRELTVSYMTFEARRKLKRSYDFFLADKRIYHRLSNKLGSQFTQRCMPIPVDLEASDLGVEILSGLSRIRFAVLARGSNEAATVAYSSMTLEKAKDNVLKVLSTIMPSWPGGKENIRLAQLQSPTGLSVPIYLEEKEFKGSFTENVKEDTFSSDLDAVKKQLST